MKYFENIIEIGNLYIEKILFEFDKMPIVFICLDDNGNRYLCLCTDSILNFTWMITKINRRILLELLTDKISILCAYEKSNNKVFILNKSVDGIAVLKYDFDNIPEEELPDETEKLGNPYLEDYIRKLELQEAMASVKNQKESAYNRHFCQAKNIFSEEQMIMRSDVEEKSRKNEAKVMISDAFRILAWMAGELPKSGYRPSKSSKTRRISILG